MTWHVAGRGIWRPASEDTLAGSFAQAQAGLLRYCHDARAWFVWDGALWRRDRTGVVSGRMRELARELCTDPGGERTAASGRPGFVVGALRFAGQEPGLAVTAADWDVDPWRLGTPEGPVDLRTGAPVAADPSDGLTRATSVAPAPPGVEAPAWCRFLEETFDGDAALIGFVQRYLGCALTSATAERTLVVACGAGAGKRTLLSSVLAAMGDYAEIAERATPPAPRTRGVRLLALADEAVGAMLASARSSWASPAPKLLAMASAPPRVSSADAGLRRRLCIVPFRHRPARPDPTLAARLRAEAPAILRWMIEGCLAWQAQGLDPPPAVAAATAEAIEEGDTLGAFLAERCACEASRTAPAADLWRAWCDFAGAAGEPAGSQTGFGAALAARGFARDRSEFQRFYRGIGLRDGLTPDTADASGRGFRTERVNSV